MAAPNSGQEFLAIPKGLLIDTINYINGSPTGAIAKGDVDRLVDSLRQCQVINLTPPAPASTPPPDGGGEPAPKPTAEDFKAVKEAVSPIEVVGG